MGTNNAVNSVEKVLIAGILRGGSKL